MKLSENERIAAKAQCASLCEAYAEYADAGNADALAELYTPHGVFDRLGQRIVGHDAIRAVIANRPADVWTRHDFSDLHIEVADDGTTATGSCNLLMQRGSRGKDSTEEVRAKFSDSYVLTAQGWRFSRREVTAAA